MDEQHEKFNTRFSGYRTLERSVTIMPLLQALGAKDKGEMQGTTHTE